MVKVANEKWERMGCGWMFCFIHMNWICNVHFFKWPWLQTMSWCRNRCWIKTSSFDCGQRLFLLPSTNQFFRIHYVGLISMCSRLGVCWRWMVFFNSDFHEKIG
jgi:hypothetical protein